MTINRFVRRNSNAPILNPPGAAAGVITLNVANSTFNLSEGMDITQFQVLRAGGANGAVSIAIHVSSDTAISSTDFTLLSSPACASVAGSSIYVDIASGVSTGEFWIDIASRPGNQGTRSFGIRILSASGGASIGDPSSATVYITDSSAGGGGGSETLDENAANYFVRVGGAGSHTGLSYANAFDLADISAQTFGVGSRLWFEQGGSWVGRTINNPTLAGTSSANPCIIGAFHRSAGSNIRGLTSANATAPILYGTSAYGLHDGTNLPSSASLFPTSPWQSLIDLNDTNNHVTIEYLNVWHSGGRGITATGATNVKLSHVYVKDCFENGILFQEGCSACVVEDSFCKGDSYGWKYYGAHPGYWAGGIAFSESNECRLRRTYCWDGWGEGISWFYGSDHVIIEDCVCVDARAVLYYWNSGYDVIVRRNLGAKTNRSQYHRSGSNRGHGLTVNNELYQFVGGGSYLTSSDVARNGVIYSNIIAGAYGGLEWWGGEGASGEDFSNVFWYSNLAIDNNANFEHWGNSWTDSRLWNNVFLRYSTGVDVSNSTLNGASASANYYSQGAPGGDMDAGIGGTTNASGTTGWRTLETLASASSDGSFSKDEIQILAAAIEGKAVLVAGGSWQNAGSSVDNRPFPSQVSVSVGPATTSFSSDTFTNRDVGPFRS